MVASALTTRAALPVLEDGLNCARLANIASEGFMEVMFGRRYEEIIATAFLETGHDTSYENVVFAETDNEIVGMTLSYSEAQHRLSTMDPQRRAAGPFRLRLRLVELLLGPLMRLNDSIKEGDFYLQFIAVDQEKRVSGVGSFLMQDYEDRARKHKAARLSLDVDVNNVVAQQFYLNRGWLVESEWPGRRFMPTLSLRMVKVL